jgi:outer membrane protein
MKKILLISAICLFSAGALYAQSNTSVYYSVGFATGDLGDYISKPSFRGIGLDYNKMIQPNIGVGFSIGWNVFYEDLPYDTYSVENVSLSGKQYRYSNHWPILASGSYYLKPGETINPFVGLGIGTIYTLRNTNMNLYTVELDAWNFALQPQVGVQFSVDDATAITLIAKYNNAFQAGGELDTDQSYFTINLGFAFIR